AAHGLRPLRERARSWGDEIVMTTRARAWRFLESSNSSSRFPDFMKSSGSSVLELVTRPTKINGVHYVQGIMIFHDVFDNEPEAGRVQIRVEGVYIWPFRQLRMVVNSGRDGEFGQEEDYILSNPYHLLGVFSSQVFQESPQDKIRKNTQSPISDMDKHCNVEISAQISRVSSTQSDGEHDRYYMEGLMESPSADDDGDCFSPMLMNATSVNIEGAAKVSILMIGQQAIMDAYLCLIHLTAGILVESLFNAFATAAFFKFVVFSIFEMRYLLAIWKANRSITNGEGWEAMRRELSLLYSRFYGILLGGILVMYEFHRYLRGILVILHLFWVPQIVSNIIGDSRKPLHPHYIVGMSLTRLAIPFYVFGCPHNFMRIQPDNKWCVTLGLLVAFQAAVLILQHYLGSRCFIPRQILPEKYCYFRRVDHDSNNINDCVICMTAIDLTQRPDDCMVTPCDHFFHSGCLQRWMDIKMECPTCRRSLPPA
ncbi:hypothetical protein M8C21_026424, partial [Ambrosia artemisiifolia]